MIIQDLWKEKLDWDDPIPSLLEEKWKKFNIELLDIDQIHVTRWFGTRKTDKIEIHGFCDASELGYGAVAYLRIKTQRRKFRIQIITSKTKVAPVRKMTIPRLELCGANLLIELEETILKIFPKEQVKIFNWTDSRVIMCWLNKESATMKVFVANRITNIQEKSTKMNIKWNWTAGEDNPADLASRGVSVSELVNADLWWHGPKWLKQNQSLWPKNTQDDSLEQRGEK